MVRRMRGAVAVALVFLLTGVSAGEGPALERVRRSEDESLAFVRAVLGREDAISSRGSFVDVLGREGQPSSTYRVVPCGAWRLPDGAVVEAAAFQDEGARRRQDKLLTSAEGERPRLDPYRGYFFGVRRVTGDGKERTERLAIPPEAVYAEIGGCGDPAWDEKLGWTLPLQHTALLFEPNLTRRLFLSSSYALATLSPAGQRQTAEDRYHLDTRKVDRFQEGKLVDSQVLDERDDPRRGFLAAGRVEDEHGKPAQNVKVHVAWFEAHAVSSVSTREVEKEETTETDRNGTFEQQVRRTRQCEVGLYKRGYLPGEYTIRHDAPFKVMRLVPIPVGTVTRQDLLGGFRNQPMLIGEIDKARGVGLSIELAPGSTGAAVGWTLNRDEADLWFEMTDPAFDEKLRTYLAPNPGRNDIDQEGALWNSETGFVMTVRGLRGTEFMPASEVEEEGLQEDHQYREAPLSAYVTEMTGLAREKPYDPNWSPKPGALPDRFYLRKGGRYGKIVRVRFAIEKDWIKQEGSPRPPEGWPARLVWKAEVGRFAMQARPLGNRLLFVAEQDFVVPPWVKGR